MLSYLFDIIEFIRYIPDYILYVIEEAADKLELGIVALFTLALSVLPAMPGPWTPPYLGYLNWFAPVGVVVGLATPIFGAYLAWMGVKWVFNKVGEL